MEFPGSAQIDEIVEVVRSKRACPQLARRVLCLVSPNRRINGDTHMRKTQLAAAVCLGVGLSMAFSMSAQAQDAYANGDGSAAANNGGTASSSIASSYNTTNTNTSSFNTTDVVAEGVLNGSVSGVSVYGIGNVASAADDLAATGVVRARNDVQQVVLAQRRRLDERDARVRNLAQVVARDFGGEAHGNAAGPIEQRKRQAGGQLARLLFGTIVVRCKVDRAFVDRV